MINPFLDFKTYREEESGIPLDRIIRTKERVMDRIMEGYIKLIEEEAKELVWLVEDSHIARAYSSAYDYIRNLEYDISDIEELFTEIDRGKTMPYLVSGPAGIYISALCNHTGEKSVRLKLNDFKRVFHFLGYRLPRGKTLIIEGNTGDFIGSCLAGGKLIVEGSTGNWTGAGMVDGEIFVRKNSGQNTGELMKGGKIQVDGYIKGIGKSISSGLIMQQRTVIFSQGRVERKKNNQK